MTPTPDQSTINAALRTVLLSMLPDGIECIQGSEAIPDPYVYIHCKPDWIPFYVGKGTGRRAIRVVTKNRNKFHQDVIKKYGAKQILIALILCASDEQAFDIERLLIAQLRTRYRLANFNDGGEGSTNPSAETRAKMSKARIGRPLSEDVCRKRSAALKGKKKSLEHVAKVAAALKGRPFSEEAHRRKLEATIGRKQSEAEKEKRAISNRGKKRSAELRARMSLAAKARFASGNHNWAIKS